MLNAAKAVPGQYGVNALEYPVAARFRDMVNALMGALQAWSPEPVNSG